MHRPVQSQANDEPVALPGQPPAAVAGQVPSAIPSSGDSTPTLASRLVGLTGGALIAYLAWNGLTGFVSQWPQAADAGRMIQTGAQLLSGAAALACLATAPSGGRWRPATYRLRAGGWCGIPR